MAAKEDPAVTNFREYIRCKTVHPDPDYRTCTEFLKRQGKELGAEVKVYEKFPGNPVVIFTLPGTDPSLPAILLNSHTDVVPVYPEHWKYDPFSAHKDEKGDIYGRGTQDMKCVGMQYVEALKRLKKNGNGNFLRTIHLSFVPDEEVSGIRGMCWFIKSEDFKALNVGFAMDEGYANPGEECFVFYGDRCPWHIWVCCPGQPGHGSQFLPNTAGEKLRRVIDRFLAFRDAEEQRLKDDPTLSLGHTTTLNLTMLKGGVQFNVVPAELSVGFDVRVPPTQDFEELEERFRGWCQEVDESVTLEMGEQTKIPQTTCVEDGKSSWWDAFAGACKKE
ncbi:aminoacylase-1-like isoform X2 [Eriocheir sinensis]|nr:aminoacylase-1-like isoform X2 [Eriocheir sinensis]